MMSYMYVVVYQLSTTNCNKEDPTNGFNLPATFSHKLIDCFGTCQHRHSSKAVDHNQNEKVAS